MSKSVGTEINKNKHKSGTVNERKAANQAIETAFLKYNKLKGVVVDGLTRRRKADANRFLAEARAELIELEKKPPVTSNSLPSVSVSKQAGPPPFAVKIVIP